MRLPNDKIERSKWFAALGRRDWLTLRCVVAVTITNCGGGVKGYGGAGGDDVVGDWKMEVPPE